MTESQVRNVAVRVVGFVSGALKRITAKHHTVNRVKRRRKQERPGGTGCDVATNVIMMGVSSRVRELLLASTLEKENMNVIIIWTLLRTRRDVTMNVTVVDARKSARRPHITITVRGKDTSSLAIKKESTSVKLTSAFDQLQTQWKHWRLNRPASSRS